MEHSEDGETRYSASRLKDQSKIAIAAVQSDRVAQLVEGGRGRFKVADDATGRHDRGGPLIHHPSTNPCHL